MSVIISDASPIHYLALIGEAHILLALYGTVIIPQKVFEKLRQTNFRASAALYEHFLELHSKRSVAS